MERRKMKETRKWKESKMEGKNKTKQTTTKKKKKVRLDLE